MKESARATKGTGGTGGTGKGNRYLARVLGEAVVGAARTDTFLGQRYRRLVRRRGKGRAIVAVGRSILTVVWHILSEPDTHFHDLGPDYHELHVNQGRKVRNHILELQHLGYHATLEPTAA